MATFGSKKALATDKAHHNFPAMQETQPTRRSSARYAEIDVERYRHELTAILSAISAAPIYNEKVLRRVLRRHPRRHRFFQ